MISGSSVIRPSISTVFVPRQPMGDLSLRLRRPPWRGSRSKTEMEEMGTISEMAVRVTAIGIGAKISKVVMGGDVASIRSTTIEIYARIAK